MLLHDAAHEWIGLAVYRLRGLTPALFPAPTPPVTEPEQAATSSG